MMEPAEPPSPTEQDGSTRTDLAADRTMLANERTLAAWWRTAMAAAAGAVAFTRLFGDVAPAWVVRGGASLLVALAFLILYVAFRRYRRTCARVDAENVDRVSGFALGSGSLLLALTAAVAGTVVWLM